MEEEDQFKAFYNDIPMTCDENDQWVQADTL
jgi:hypothetical protein